MEGLKINKTELQNWMQIKSKTFEANGRSFIIFGPNESGKSSFLQAIRGPLDANFIPAEPVTKGEERGMIRGVYGGELNGESRDYTIDVYFTPSNQKGRLVMTNEKGEQVKAPKTLIQNIFGNISFNIYDFFSAPKEKRVKILKQLSGKEIELDAVDIKINAAKKDRTALGNKIDVNEAQMQGHGYTKEQIQLYSKPIPIEPIEKEIQAVSGAQEKYSEVEKKKMVRENKHKELEGRIETLDRELISNNGRIEELQNQINGLKLRNTFIAEETVKIDAENKTNDKEYEMCIKWLDNNPKPNVEALTTKLTEATLHNEHNRKITEYSEKARGIRKDKEDLQNILVNLENLDKEKMGIIEGSKLPVKGLTFDDDQIYYVTKNGKLPLEEGQINTQQLLDISEEISLAMHPNLKVAFLPEASLYDRTNLERCIKKLEARGYQVIAEIVDDTVSEMQIEFTEDYFNKVKPAKKVTA